MKINLNFLNKEKSEVRDVLVSTTVTPTVRKKLDLLCKQNNVTKSILLNNVIEQLVKDVKDE